MKTKILLFLGTILIFLAVPKLWAEDMMKKSDDSMDSTMMEESDDSMDAAMTKKSDDSMDAPMEDSMMQVPNKICPISGEETDEHGAPYVYEYKGKKYNLCCAMCVKDFKKDPDKYVKMIEDQMMKDAGSDSVDE